MLVDIYKLFWLFLNPQPTFHRIQWLERKSHSEDTRRMKLMDEYFASSANYPLVSPGKSRLGHNEADVHQFYRDNVPTIQ